jgi:hypothetical protein
MKRVVIAIGLALAVALTAAACGVAKETPGRPDGPVAFEMLTESQWPAEVKDWVAGASKNQTAAFNESKAFGDKTYLLVYAGERTSGGYNVVVDKVQSAGGKVTVTAHVDPPTGPATAVISYPLGVARIARHDGPIGWSIRP